MTRVMVAIVLALAACESTSNTPIQDAWVACAGIEAWAAHSECLNQYQVQRAHQSRSEDAAAWMLLGGTAVMNGYNAGRARPMVMCTTSYGLTTCY